MAISAVFYRTVAGSLKLTGAYILDKSYPIRLLAYFNRKINDVP